MYGVIFDFLRDYVIENHGGEQTWRMLLKDIGQSVHKIYFPITEYPDDEIVALAQTASAALNVPLPTVLEDFGRYTGHKLVTFYHMYVKSKEWKTFDVIENAGSSIHDAVHRHNATRKPPHVRGKRVSDNDMYVYYQSKRKLCFVVRGIITGLGEHFGESFDIQQEQCMLHGAHECVFHVKRMGVVF